MDIIKIAEDFATEKHKGQFRFDGVTPYIEHPMEVARRVTNSWRVSENEVAVAILHDTREDCGVTNEDLEKIGMPKEVIEAVGVLTKRDGIDYQEYLKQVHQNPIARRVKIHDMLANLSDSPSKKQVKKYADGLTFLLNGII